MHIYDKQCGIMQKINGRVQTVRFSVFTNFNTIGRQELFAKKHGKLGKLKRPLLKILCYPHIWNPESVLFHMVCTPLV